MKLSVGIVLYNPNIDNLKNNIKEIEEIADYIFLIDNNSKNFDLIKKIHKGNIIVKSNSSNLGIAKALNQILELSYEKNVDYLLTLDQDSILSKKTIEEMLKYVNNKDVAIVCPIINDLNRNKQAIQKEETLEVNRCITSGSLMNLKVCKDIGFFDEKMFIDYVDFDYCKRITLSNKKILRIKNAVLDHEIGKRSTRKFLFWQVYPTNHNANRIYFFSRNIKYYLRKYSKRLSFKEYLHDYIHLAWKLVCIILYENDKRNKIQKFFNGIKDSKKMVLE